MLRLALILILLSAPAMAQTKESVREWIRSQQTEFPVEYWPVGINCCDASDGKFRKVEEIGKNHWRTWDDDGTPLEFHQNALGVKHDSPFYQWFVYIVNRKVICARRPQIGG